MLTEAACTSLHVPRPAHAENVRPALEAWHRGLGRAAEGEMGWKEGGEQEGQWAGQPRQGNRGRNQTLG